MWPGGLFVVLVVNLMPFRLRPEVLLPFKNMHPGITSSEAHDGVALRIVTDLSAQVEQVDDDGAVHAEASVAERPCAAFGGM